MLGDNYPQTLPIIWQEVPIKSERAKDNCSKEELTATYLNYKDKDFLVVGRETLRKEKEKDTAKAAAKAIVVPSSSNQGEIFAPKP